MFDLINYAENNNIAIHYNNSVEEVDKLIGKISRADNIVKKVISQLN